MYVTGVPGNPVITFVVTLLLATRDETHRDIATNQKYHIIKSKKISSNTASQGDRRQLSMNYNTSGHLMLLRRR